MSAVYTDRHKKTVGEQRRGVKGKENEMNNIERTQCGKIEKNKGKKKGTNMILTLQL
jgi:hypothetical protein